jgi:hypothetical protein
MTLAITLVLAAPTASFATSMAGGPAGLYAANAGVLSDRRCRRGPKQEICDWVKGDHNTPPHH